MPRRRSPGTGSVVARKDGTFEARYNGRTRRARSRREALSHLAALRSAPPVTPKQAGGEPLADYLRRWLKETVALTVSPPTQRLYTTHVERHLIPGIGHIPVRALSPAHVQALLATLSETLGPGTVRLSRGILRSALRQAEDWDLVERNAAARARPPRYSRPEPAALSAETGQAILRAVRGTAAEGPATLALLYGLRIGEAVGLCWVDVDGETVTVAGQLGAGERHAPTKTRDVRVLPLLPTVARMLHRARLRQVEQRLAAGPAWIDSGWVFTRTDGRPLSRDIVRPVFRDALRAAGLPHMRFHDLRHGTASLLAALGVHPRVAMAILGHLDARQHAHYQHIDPALMRAELLRLDAALGGGTVAES